MAKQKYLRPFLVPLFIAFLGICFSLPTDTEAAAVRKGQVGFRFLENPVSAEAIGRGALGVVLTQNANTVFWNPAGLGWLNGRMDFGVNYTNGIADINHSSVAAALKLGNTSYLSVDGFFMDYGTLNGTVRAENDQGFEETGGFSPNAYALGISFAQRVSNRFSYGVRLKYANQNLGTAWVGEIVDSSLVRSKKTYAMGEPTLDVGAIYDFQAYGLRFGAVMKNVSREVRYEEDRFPLPYAVSFSMSFQPLSFFSESATSKSLVFGFETEHPRDFKERLKFGAEYYIQNILIVRGGYMDNYDERGLTFGLGVRPPEYFNSRIRVDYAYQAFGLFGAAHYISFGFTH